MADNEKSPLQRRASNGGSSRGPARERREPVNSNDRGHPVLFPLAPKEQNDLPLFDNGRPFRVTEFGLRDLHRHIRGFAFMRGEKAVRSDPEDPANLKATQLLANLHDALDATGYQGHALERYLVRLLFCLFADDTGIFDAPGMFTALVERTREDGSDLGPLLSQFWDVLNTDIPDRQSNRPCSARSPSRIPTTSPFQRSLQSGRVEGRADKSRRA